jgi:hypothetical protein
MSATTTLPPHDGGTFAPVPATAVATWPAGSFVENLVVDPAGTIFATIHPAGEIRRVAPDGTESLYVTLPTPLAGITLDGAGNLFVSGGTPGIAGGVIWRVSPTGVTERWLDLPEAMFLNGITPALGGGMLVVDSILGRVWRFETTRQAATVWLEDARLTPLPGIQGLPGVNGIKRFGARFALSNTTRATIFATSADAHGSAGPLEILAETLRADDIAFDAMGALYCTTHMHHSLVRLDPDGTRTTLAGPAQGMAGSTAAAFGRGQTDRLALYVTATGGVGAPFEGKLQPAKLVRLEIGVPGASLL